MGVDGLLKFLQPIIAKKHLSAFRNSTAAVDAMSWIYRACYAASIHDNPEPDSPAFLIYLHQMIDLLSYYQIKMICVFDGRFLPHKQQTIDKRRKERENNRKRGEELISKGEEESAKKYRNRCVTIDEHIISTAIRALRVREIPFMVAPYEADCQIAKLYRQSLVDFAICEDSDLVIYGVPVLLKLSSEGDCDFLDINRINYQNVDNVFIQQFLKLDMIRRTEVAVLAGTDYLPSIKGVGIKKALKFVAQSASLLDAIRKIEAIAKFKQQKPQGYERKAQEALLIFLFSTTFSHNNSKLEFLNENASDISFVTIQYSLENLRSLAGLDYGYDEQVRQGKRRPWSLESRDLTPIKYDGKKNLNESALRQREIYFSNLKIIDNRQRSKIAVSNRQELVQDELRVMCESRQTSQKCQSVNEFKKQLENALDKEVELILSVTTAKLASFKQKFPSWMNYCPHGSSLAAGN